MHEAYGGKSCLVEAVAVGFVILGGIGLVAGGLLTDQNSVGRSGGGSTPPVAETPASSSSRR